MLPEVLAAEVRRIARQAAMQAIDAYSVPRSEVLELVAGLAPPLQPDDVAALKVMLPWWAHHRRGMQVLAVELVALALADPGGGEVRSGLAAVLAAPHPAKQMGRMLKRCAWRPVAGFYVRYTPPGHRRDSVLFSVESCT